MIIFNEKKFEKIISDDTLTIYGLESGKLYFLNDTCKLMLDQLLDNMTLEEIITSFCDSKEYDWNSVQRDFNNTLAYLLQEGIIYYD